MASFRSVYCSGNAPWLYCRPGKGGHHGTGSGRRYKAGDGAGNRGVVTIRRRRKRIIADFRYIGRSDRRSGCRHRETGLGTGEGQAALGAESLKTVKLLAVGDDLIHSGIFKSGFQSDGTYNFDHLYEHVKDEISAADLAVVNQETIFTYNRNDYSGYPCFAGPVEIGDALVDAGFDVVTHATNHTFDRNVQGILDTLDFWKTKHPEITVLGIHESQGGSGYDQDCGM